MLSFSCKIRDEIYKLEEKQKTCCLFSLIYGFFAFDKANNEEYVTISTNAENVKILYNTIENLNFKKQIKYKINGRKILLESNVLRFSTIVEIARNVFKCEHCRATFLRGVFLRCGSVTDPCKSHRMDLSFNDYNTAIDLLNMLKEINLNFKVLHRKNKTVLYSKNAEEIADFIAIIGATNCAFEIFNSKILKEIRNDANRINNCDSANIDKTLRANEKYLVAIKELIDTGKILMLPDHLQLMAKKRLEFSDLSFAELGKKFSPPISKSGVFHRLEKILDFYNSLKNDKII